MDYSPTSASFRTPKVGVRLVKNVDSIFRLRTDTEFALKNFANRISAVVPFFGYTAKHTKNLSFENFSDAERELLNFKKSKMGQLASKINADLEYYIFGVNSYVKVVKCKICRKGIQCGRDHHLDAVLNDVAKNNKLKNASVTDFNLQRPFELVSSNLLQSESVKLNTIFDVASRDTWCQPLIADSLELTDSFLRQGCSIFYPRGELCLNENGLFEFDEQKCDTNHSVISTICLSGKLINFNALETAAVLIESNEPKQMVSNGDTVQTLNMSGFALYCFWRNLNKMTEPSFDFLFTDHDISGLRMKSLGAVRENLLPFGLILLICRLEVEREIKEVLGHFIDFAKKHLREEISFDETGAPYLVSDPKSGLIGVIRSKLFPPLNDTNKSVKSSFLSHVAGICVSNSSFLEARIVSKSLITDLYREAESAESEWLYARGMTGSLSASEQVRKMFDGSLKLSVDCEQDSLPTNPPQPPFSVFVDPPAQTEQPPLPDPPLSPPIPPPEAWEAVRPKVRKRAPLSVKPASVQQPKSSRSSKAVDATHARNTHIVKSSNYREAKENRCTNPFLTDAPIITTSPIGLPLPPLPPRAESLPSEYESQMPPLELIGETMGEPSDEGLNNLGELRVDKLKQLGEPVEGELGELQVDKLKQLGEPVEGELGEPRVDKLKQLSEPVEGKINEEVVTEDQLKAREELKKVISSTPIIKTPHIPRKSVGISDNVSIHNISPIYGFDDLNGKTLPSNNGKKSEKKTGKTIRDGVIYKKPTSSTVSSQKTYDPMLHLKSSFQNDKKSGLHFDSPKVKDCIINACSDDEAIAIATLCSDEEKAEKRRNFFDNFRKNKISNKLKSKSSDDLIEKEVKNKFDNFKLHNLELEKNKKKLHDRNAMQDVMNYQRPVYDKNSHRKSYDTKQNLSYFKTKSLDDLYKTKDNNNKSDSEDDRSRYERKILDKNREEAKKTLGISPTCRRNHILKCMTADIICDMCSTQQYGTKALYCDICNYAICNDCKINSKSSNLKQKTHHNYNNNYYRNQNGDDEEEETEEEEEDYGSSFEYKRGKKKNEDDDTTDDDDDDHYRDRRNNLKNRRSKKKKNKKGKGSSSDNSDSDQNRGRRHRVSYRERREEIAYKSKVLGPLKPYTMSTNFRDFFDKLTTRVEYLEFTEKEKRIHLLEHIQDDGLRANIAQVLKDNPSCNWQRLGTKLFLALGVKSKNLMEAEAQHLDRVEGESVNSYAMRLRDLRTKLAMTTKDGESFLNSELFEKMLLTDFLRGLKSSFMVNKVINKEAQTLNDALLIIESELAKEKKKEIFNQGQNYSLSSDKQLYNNPQSAKYFSNNSIYQDGELTFDGEIFSLETVNEIGDVCRSCGNDKKHNGQTCRATSSKCLLCGKVGHFARMCQQTFKDKQNGLPKHTQTTPAQKRFQEKQRRKNQFNKKINNIELSNSETSDSETESEKNYGQFSASDSEEEFRNEINQLINKRYAQKKTKKPAKKEQPELRRINILNEENVFALSTLPFLHCYLFDFVNNKAPVKALFDTGASVSVVSKKFLEKNNLIFAPITYKAKLCGFGGQTTNTNLKGAFSIGLGFEKTEPLEFVVYHSDKPSYDVIIGFDLQTKLKIHLSFEKDKPMFLHKNRKIPAYNINDELNEKDIESLNSIDEENEQKNKVEILSSTGATLRGNDNFFLPINAHNAAPGIYKINLKNKRLQLQNDEVALLFVSKKSTALSGILSLKFNGKKSEYISIHKNDSLGEAIPVNEEKINNFEIEFCSYLDVQKKTEDKEKILIYPVKKIPTEEELKKVKNAHKKRREAWTRELVELEAKEWLPNVPSKYKEATIDLVMQYREIFVRKMEDLEEGLLYFEMDAHIPPHLPFFAAHKKRIGTVMEPIYKKSQENLINHGLAENALTPIFVHPYSLVQKKGCKFPATEEEALKMSHEFCRKCFRVVMDASFLTKYTKSHNIGYTPELAEAIGFLNEDDLKSFFDLSSSFHQINLSARKDDQGRCIRDLFATYAYIDGLQYIRSRKLTMGFTGSTFLSSYIFKTIIDVACLVPLNTSVNEFVEIAKGIENGKNPPSTQNGKNYPKVSKSYIDDCFNSTPTKNLEKYSLSAKSYFRPPKNYEDKIHFLHLQSLAKNFAQCKRHNLLLELKKTFILTHNSFEFLGYKFERIKELQVLKCPERKLEVMRSFKPPKTVSETQSIIGFFSFFSILIRNSRTLMKPLIDLIRKDQPYEWMDTAQQCFDELKR